MKKHIIKIAIIIILFSIILPLIVKKSLDFIDNSPKGDAKLVVYNLEEKKDIFLPIKILIKRILFR